MGEKEMTIPLWVYFTVGGILISAFMAVKTAKEEAELEKERIEAEGEEYMKRLQDEKARNLKSMHEGN